MKWLVLYCILIFITTECVLTRELKEHRCIHEQIKIGRRQTYNPHKGVVYDAQLSDMMRKGEPEEQRPWKNFEILTLSTFAPKGFPSISTLPRQDGSELSDILKMNITKSVIEPVVSYVSDMFEVKKNVNNSSIFIDKNLEYLLEDEITFKLSKETVEKMKSSDFTLFITAIPIELDYVEAYTVILGTSTAGERPDLAWVNLNPIDLVDTSQHEQMRITFLHELTHALGFTNDVFQAKGMLGSIIVHDGQQNAGGASSSIKFYIKSERVKQFARQHFNCPTLLGAYMEDLAQEGTYANHWERSMFLNEYMTGSSSQDSIITMLTISALEDTEWYRYTGKGRVEKLRWGSAAGCGMASTWGCSAWPEGYSCDNQIEYGLECSKSMMGYGWCIHDSRPYLIGEECTYRSSMILCPKQEVFGDNSEQIESSICINAEVRKGDTTLRLPGCYTATCHKNRSDISVTSNNSSDSFKLYSCREETADNSQPETGGKILDCLQEPKQEFCRAADIFEWPSLKSIDPNRANPGTEVVITGNNLSPNAMVYIGGPCLYVKSISPTQFVYKLPSFHSIQFNTGSGHLLDVVYTDAQKRSDVLLLGFEPEFTETFGQRLGWLVKENLPLIASFTVILLLCIISLILVSHYS